MAPTYNLDYTYTFLSQITLGRQFNAYECINYTGHWCQFCGEDNGGGKFCYECGKQEEAEEEEEDVFGNINKIDKQKGQLEESEEEDSDEEEASELDTNSDDGSEEDDDDFDYENSCDCCVKGWTEPNEFGLCQCCCSNCDNLLSDCRYRCRVKNPLTGFYIEGEINKEFLKELNAEEDEE